MASGMMGISASGGGSEEMNTLKLGWVLGLDDTASKNPSSPCIPVSHDCIKCTF